MGIHKWWWIRKLQNGSPEEREQAARKLGEMHPVLIIVPKFDEETLVRAKMAYALGEIGGKGAVEQLAKMVGDEDAGVRMYVTEALGDTRYARAVEPLMKLLGDKDETVRSRAEEALGKIGEPAVEPLIKALNDENENVRKGAAKALGKTGKPAVKPLIKALEDESNPMRYEMAGILAPLVKYDEQALVPMMIRLLKHDRDGAIRTWAADALGNADRLADSAIPALIEALKGPSRNTWIHAADSLAKLAEKAVPSLTDALSHEDAPVRAGAANAFAYMGRMGKACAGNAVSLLIRNLDDPDEEARKEAAGALGDIKNVPAEVLPALHKKAFERPELRKELQDAIANISKNAKRPSGVREVSERPKEVGIERMFRGMASDVRQPKIARF